MLVCDHASCLPYRYWGLGFHNCRFGYRTIDIVEEVVANYSAAMVGGTKAHHSLTLYVV